MRHDFLSVKLITRKWKEKPEGNTSYSSLYQHMLQVTKTKYEDDILLLLSDLLPSTCTKIRFEPASDLRIHSRKHFLKVECLCISSPFFFFIVEYRYCVPIINYSTTNTILFGLTL